MAEVRTITIEIVQKNESGQPKSNDNKAQENSSSEGKTLLKSFILNQSYQTAKKLIVQSVEASVNNYIALSEDYFAENTYNKVKTTISKVTSAGSTIIGGAVAGGQVGGPVGAVVGAVIGTIGWGVSEYINYQARMGSYYRALNASNIEKDYMRRRSGLYNDGKGTLN